MSHPVYMYMIFLCNLHDMIGQSKKIPECTCPMSHNAPLWNRNVHIVCSKVVHCGIQDICIVGFVNLVYCCCMVFVTDLEDFHHFLSHNVSIIPLCISCIYLCSLPKECLCFNEIIILSTICMPVHLMNILTCIWYYHFTCHYHVRSFNEYSYCNEVISLHIIYILTH